MNKKRFFICLLALIFVWQLPVAQVFAHAFGASWEKTVNNYKIDVGYDVSKFVSGQSVRFDFNLIDVSQTQILDFTDVWVRIGQGQQTVFASGIHKPVFGNAGMTFVFPKAGSYDLDVRFENADKTIVQTSFPINVETEDATPAAPSAFPVIPLAAGAAGLAVGFILRMFVMREKK